MANTKRPNPFTDKNYVQHDQIDVLGTINYTERDRFYNAVQELISQKIDMAQRMRKQHPDFQPIIRINFATPDTQEYKRQSERFFNLLEWARHSHLIIETNIAGPICLNSWAGKIVRDMATPGYRHVLEDGYYFYYPETYNPETKKTQLVTNPVNISPEKSLEMGLCDVIFLGDGRIKTR